jgi:hypothetical protein
MVSEELLSPDLHTTASSGGVLKSSPNSTGKEGDGLSPGTELCQCFPVLSVF